MENSTEQISIQDGTRKEGTRPCFYQGVSETLQFHYFYNTNLVLTPVTILLGLWCFLSNGSVLFVVLRGSFRKRAAFLMLCSLTLTDFLWGGVVVPVYVKFRMEEFIGGKVCANRGDWDDRAMVIPFFLCLFGTVGNLAVISVDRYLAVAKAMWYKVSVNQRHAFVGCSTIWFISISIVTLKQIEIIEIKWIENFEACYVALTSTTIIVVQLFTLRFLFKHNSNVAEMNANAANAATAVIERRLTVATSYVVGLLLIVFIPSAIIVVVSDSVQLFIEPMFFPVASLCSSINPVLYYRHNAHIRDGIRNLVKCC